MGAYDQSFEHVIEARFGRLEDNINRTLARAASSASGSKALKLLDSADDFIKVMLTTAGVIGGAGLVGFGLELAGVAGAGQVAAMGGLVTGGAALWIRCAIELVEGVTVNINLNVPERLAAHTLRFMAEQMDKSADRVIIGNAASLDLVRPDARLAGDLVAFLEKGDDVGFSFRAMHQQVLDNGTKVTRDVWQELSDILTGANILVKDKGGTRLALPLDVAVGLVHHPALSG